MRSPVQPLRVLLLAAFLATLLVFSVFSAVGSPQDFQSDHRLLPLFLFAHGLPVYGDPADTPIFSPIYAPLSFLAYFPALLFRSPAPAILCAKLMAQLYAVFPILWLLGRRSRQILTGIEATVVLMSLALAAIGWGPSLDYLTILHADAPAFFLCFCACILTGRLSETSASRLLAALALCCVLAPFTKQPAWPIVFVPLIVISRLRLWKLIARLITAYLALMALVGGFFLFLFRDQRMLFWILEVPARHLRHVSRARFIFAFRILLTSRTSLILIVFVICWLLKLFFGRRKVPPCDIESVFFVAALVGLPGAILGCAKPGGGYNTLLFFLYFAFIGALLWVQRLTGALSYPAGLSVAIVVLCGITLGYRLTPNALLAWNPEHGFRETAAYEYMRRHPGQIWFPRYPLAGYLAEGKVYHCNMGLLDRFYAELPTSDALLNKYIPNGGRIIACADDCRFKREPMLHYRSISLPELPGNWKIDERTDQGTFHFDEKQ
jgi:hypothetical protein